MTATERPLRILMVCDLWQGSDSYALARAFRRDGHSVTIVSDSTYYGREWRHPLLRGARKLLRPFIVRDFNDALMQERRGLAAASAVRLQGAAGRAARRSRPPSAPARWRRFGGPTSASSRMARRFRAPCRITTGSSPPRPSGIADLKDEVRGDPGLVPAARLPSRGASHVPLRRQRPRALRLRRLVHRHLVAEEAGAARGAGRSSARA